MVDVNTLKELARLRDSGVLSEAEYENEKMKILNTDDSTVYPFPNQPVYGQQAQNHTRPTEQTGLIVASYVCAVVSLLFCPLALGIIGMVLGFYAKSQGDDRGTLAGIVCLICMIIGMFVGMLVGISMFSEGY